MLLKCDELIPERKKHIVRKGEKGCGKGKGKPCEISCNVPTTPGDMTERGCTFAGCRGVVGGPVKDVIHITHGPIGCAAYSWGYRPHLADSDFHMKYIFVSDIEEKDIIFGGEKKLLNSILEANKEFPEVKGVFIYNTCSPALIGDDGKDVAKIASEKIKKPVIFFPCEGFRGVSQSQGHHVGNLTIFRDLVGTAEPDAPSAYGINLVGEYNIKGDMNNILPLFQEMGVDVITAFTGNASIDDLKVMHRAKLNVVHCTRSATYIAEMMKEEYGTPYIDVTLWGIENTSAALRETAKFFGLEKEAERVIAREIEYIKPKIEYYKERLAGKHVFIYQGAPRAWHWVQLMHELGMEVIAAATTFGHVDDYEKIFQKVKEGTLVVDNPNALEIEEILEEFKPDLFIAGNKEKYISYKMGQPFVNGHTYDSGPYAGFRGMIKFARDMDKAINSPVWKLVKEKANRMEVL
ncbi:nitrogenase iron-iron protein alpha chain [archaeon BMS3Abin16]|nr:nitrogenase iron-iron protein alpha chain [archaeon BMS3Abin16]